MSASQKQSSAQGIADVSCVTENAQAVNAASHSAHFSPKSSPGCIASV